MARTKQGWGRGYLMAETDSTSEGKHDDESQKPLSEMFSSDMFLIDDGGEKPKQVHSDLLASQSASLYVLVNGQFVEGQTKMAIWAEDPDIVGRFLEFLYRGTYSPVDLLGHVKLYVLASVHMIDKLQDFVCDQFQEALENKKWDGEFVTHKAGDSFSNPGDRKAKNDLKSPDEDEDDGYKEFFEVVGFIYEKVDDHGNSMDPLKKVALDYLVEEPRDMLESASCRKLMSSKKLFRDEVISNLLDLTEEQGPSSSDTGGKAPRTTYDFRLNGKKAD